MKQYLFLFAFGMLLNSCNSHDGKTGSAPVPTPEKIQVKIAELATNKDLVCDMELSQDGLADTAVVDGKIYGFCNVGCKQEFLQDKAKYLK
jgi:YHS domain-containing protein